jgi:hypothetical protein
MVAGMLNPKAHMLAAALLYSTVQEAAFTVQYAIFQAIAE